MNFILFICISVAFLAFSTNAESTVYYVSTSGNNNNNGTSQSTPWKTISKVNLMMSTFNAGDQILFKRGNTFNESLIIARSGSAGNDIVFGSYGTGNLPVITGKKAITGWTLHTGNIYKATIADTISHIYINNELMTIARYPNSGFLKVDAGNGTSGFYDAALNQTAGYWNGANCRLRSINWAYETKIVSSFSGGNVVYTSGSQYAVAVNYGYYFDNKLILLDAQNEWYQDKTTNTVYLYAPFGVNPNTLTVEGCVKSIAVSSGISVSNLKFQDLNFNGFRDAGFIINGSSISIKACSISQTAKYGININGSNITVENNLIEDNLNVAITGTITNCLVKNNIIRRTGLIPGYGSAGLGYSGISAYIFTGSTLEGNTIDSSGYSGILAGSNLIIKNNVINNSLLVLNDGAGIDVVSTADGIQILNNIIGNTIGNIESSAVNSLYGIGIYINGVLLKNSVIQGNTIYSNSYAGMNYDHKNTTINNKILKNIFYNNFNSQIIFTDYSASTFVPVYSDVIKGNVFYSLQSEQNCMKQMMFNSPTVSDFGAFDSNYYCNPYSEYVVRRTIMNPWSDNTYNLSNWKTTFAEDLNSKASLVTFDQYGITDSIGSNMITNSKFVNNVDYWAPWPAGATIGWVNHSLLDTGTMRIRWNGTGYHQSLTMSSRYSIVKNQYYLVSISAVGNHSGTFNLWGRSSFSSSFETFPQKFFSYQNYRKDHSFTFRADTTDPLAFVSVGMILPDTLIYVDNISIYNVLVEKIDSTQKSKLFVNMNSSPSSFSLAGTTYKDLDGNPVNGSITLQPFSSRILVDENFLPVRVLQLMALMEGFYSTGTDKMKEDTVMVELRSSSSPYNLISSYNSILDSNGNGSFNFPAANNSVNYYIVVKHRNSVETWSSSAVSFSNNQLAYDFTTAAAKAFGNNQKLMGSRYCIYAGDVNNDGVVDVADLVLVNNQVILFTTGFRDEDINGDLIVDASDLNLVHNNSINWVAIVRP